MNQEANDKASSGDESGPLNNEHENRTAQKLSSKNPATLSEGLTWRLLKNTAFLIHISAFLSTIAILQLRIRQVYWADVADVKNHFYHGDWRKPGRNVLNLLQYAARFHEALIVSSISAMLMHRVRRMLLNSGVPFGALMGAYTISSASWLRHKAFRQPLLRSPWNFRFFTLLVGLATVFASLVGPSSAVALQPDLKWWPITRPAHSPTIIAYLNKSFNELYPLELLEPNPQCRFPDNATAVQCPGAGFQTLLTWTTGFAHGNPGSQNLTMSQPPVDTVRYIATILATTVDKPGRVIAATISTSIVSVFGFLASSIKYSGDAWLQLQNTARVKLEISDMTPVLAPVTQVQCASYDHAAVSVSDPIENVTFHTGYLYDDTEIDIPVPPELWNVSNSLDSLNFTWSHILGHDDLLGAVILVPYVEHIVDRNSNDTSQRSMIITCAIQTRWAPAKIQSEPNSNNMVVGNISTQDLAVDNDEGDGTLMRSSELREKYKLSAPIRIDPKWAATLDLPVGGARTKDDEPVQNATAMEALLLPWISRYNITVLQDTPGNPPNTSTESGTGDLRHFFTSLVWDQATTSPMIVYHRALLNTISQTLGMAVGDGVARAVPAPIEVNEVETLWGEDGLPPFYARENAAPGEPGKVFLVKGTQPIIRDLLPSNGSWVTFEVSRYGYGYGFESGTAIFGVAVLATYLIVAVAYLVYYFIFLVFRNGWTCTAWTAVGDLVALALISSPPPGMKMSGVEFQKFGDWAVKLSVRERSSQREAAQPLIEQQDGEPDSPNTELQLLIGDNDERLENCSKMVVGKAYD